jgi:hypothetical protein
VWIDGSVDRWQCGWLCGCGLLCDDVWLWGLCDAVLIGALLFRDFVDAGVQILASARGLKHLHGKAQGACGSMAVWLGGWLCGCG